MKRTFLLQREQWIARQVGEVFAFFADPRNLEAITPPWLGFRIVSPGPITMRAGADIVYRIRWHGLPLRWVTAITEWQPGVRFVDVQRRGPYALWYHTHEFEPHEGGTRIRDHVRYELPLGMVGALMHRLIVRRELEAIFDYRARAVVAIFHDRGTSASAWTPRANGPT